MVGEVAGVADCGGVAGHTAVDEGGAGVALAAGQDIACDALAGCAGDLELKGAVA